MRKCLILLLIPACSANKPVSEKVHQKQSEIVLITSAITSSPKTISSANPKEPKPNIRPKPKCSEDFSHIKGNYCPDVRQTCIDYLDNPSLQYARCKKFDKSVCLSKTKEPMEYCISTEELYDLSTKMPYGNKSWLDCKAMCEQKNARLCSTEEWTFACEGEEMLPYPYGYERQSAWCNIDTYDTKEKPVVCGKVSCDYRATIDKFPLCKSPFGIHNMTGNLDEYVETKPYSHSMYPAWRLVSGLKGGHWLPVRNRCRPVTLDHDEHFKQITTGCRCCSNVLN